MKAVASLVVLVIASCATATEPETAATQEAATIDDAVTRALPEVNTTCLWVPGKTCYGMTNDGNNIWPLNVGIHKIQVLTRFGPDRLAGKQPTFLAFVVWNNAVVGRIFEIDVGTSAAANWNATLGNIVAGRTFNLFDAAAGSAGATAGGPVPPPHPQVDQAIVFDAPYLDAVKRYAGVIDDATQGFLGTRAAGFD
ncbi:MAG TPA: hypothetical protein VK601_13020 [Kofleriaceae bacterium]|nr:hypothetical protein [Kofleriaceae bacterium]